MDFSFTEEQTLLRNMVQSFVSDNYDFDTRMKIVRSEDGMDRSIWQQFAELGLLAAPFSEEMGGIQLKCGFWSDIALGVCDLCGRIYRLRVK